MANLLGKFFGRTASEGAAFALGIATGPVLYPAVREIANEANRVHPSAAIDAGAAAEIVAEDVERRDWGANEAAAHGISGDRFDSIVGAVLNAPGVPQLLELHRRGAIDDAELAHGFRKAKLETEWDRPLSVLLSVLLAPAELANARQQGYIDQTRQHAEAALQGIDGERAEIQYEMVGLPPGVAEALTMLRRGIIDEARFAQIVREGHTKTKYTAELLELQNVVLSPATYATLHLKGWLSEADMIAGGALSGESADNMRKMYLAAGRPAAPSQMATAAARGIDGPDGRPMDRPQFLKGIAQSDIRPEYGPMLWDARFLYPSLFQLSRLVSAGSIDVDTAADWATKDRYAPEVVRVLRLAWGQSSTGSAKGLTAADLAADYEGLLLTRDEYIAALRDMGYTATAAAGKARVSDAKRRRQARNQLIARARTRFTGWRIDEPAARKALTAARIDAALQDELIASWQVERDINAADLTPAQIKKAYRRALMTRDEAVAELEARGYDENETRLLLDE